MSALLQQLKGWTRLLVENRHLPVQHGVVGKDRQRRTQVGKKIGRLDAAAVVKTWPIIKGTGAHTIAIVLELKKPVGIRKGRVPGLGQHGLEVVEIRMAPLQPSGLELADDLRGQVDSVAQLIDFEAREDRGIVVVGCLLFFGIGIGFLDQQPLVVLF